MNAWWSQLAAREKLLIGVAVALTVVLAFWQFVLVPSMANRAEAEARLGDADRTLARMQEGYMLNRARGSAAPTNTGPSSGGIEAFKAAITTSASDMGLSIARLQGNDTTTVRLVFENVDPRLIFLWLEDIQAKHSAQASRFSMEQSGNGLVRVNVDLVGGGL